MGAHEHAWQIGIAGTFDVENYGDLLFPFLAERELGERLGNVCLHRFSYRARSADEWHYPVTSVADLPRIMPRLDGMLVGGGYLIRFDKRVAPGYAPPSEAIHHPTGYWLTPALLALQHGVPLVWNAPGMHRNGLPEWAEPLLRLALSQSAYVAVRDEPSRAALAPLAGDREVLAVPDTAFALSRTIESHPELSAELARLLEELGLGQRRYLAIQAATGMVPFIRFLARHETSLGDLAILALPVSPELTEDEAIVTELLPRAVAPRKWPHPLLMAELIRHAAAVAGHSYHLAITALTTGVPVFRPPGFSGKFSVLSSIGSIYPLPGDDDAGIETFLARVSPGEPPPQLARLLEDVATHWDRVVGAIRLGRTRSPEEVGRFLQALPGILERMAGAAGEPDRQLAATDERAAEYNRPPAVSASRRLTAPLRAFGRRFANRFKLR